MTTSRERKVSLNQIEAGAMREFRQLVGITPRFTLYETAADTIDAEWIDGIRRGWVQLQAEVSFHTLVGVNREERLRAAVSKLRRVYQYIVDLRKDLSITKGIYPERISSRKNEEEKAAYHIYEWLRDALGQLKDASQIIASSEVFGRLAQDGYEGTLESVDGLLRDVFKQLEVLLEKYGDDYPDGVQKLRWADWYADTPDSRSVVPNEVSLGRLKVIFADTPEDPTVLRGSLHLGTKVKGYRKPFKREKYIKAFDRAKKMLQRSKLANTVWYGNVFIYPSGAAGELEPGKGFTQATYSTGEDVVRILADPSDYNFSKMAAVLIHELGHRFYYKVLTARSRRLFASTFGKVPAVSLYGGKSPAEDFAEAFAAYVMGAAWKRTTPFWDTAKGVMVKPKPMTREQYKRMADFMRSRRRLSREDLMTSESGLLEQLILAGIKPRGGTTRVPKVEGLSWEKTKTGYEMKTTKGVAKLFRKGRQWYLSFGDREIRLGPRATFDRAEGELAIMLSKVG